MKSPSSGRGHWDSGRWLTLPGRLELWLSGVHFLYYLPVFPLWNNLHCGLWFFLWLPLKLLYYSLFSLLFSNPHPSLTEKAMATHSSTLAWKIPWTEEPGGLQSLWLWRVGHDWATSLPLSCLGEGNGNPLQCSCLENPRDRGAWWAAVYGVAQSRTWLKPFSSSSSSIHFWRSRLYLPPLWLVKISSSSGSLFYFQLRWKLCVDLWCLSFLKKYLLTFGCIGSQLWHMSSLVVALGLQSCVLCGCGVWA